MSYIQRVKVAEGASGFDTLVGTLINAIKDITSWTLDSDTNTLNISDNLKLNIQYDSDGFRCGVSSIGSTVVSENVILFKPSGGINNYIYLNYVKSSDGKCIAFGFNSFTSTPNEVYINVIIDEDDMGNKSAIMINRTPTTACKLLYNGYLCELDFNYIQSGTKVLSTSICKQPNYLSGSMFKNVYRILSCPLTPTQLYSTVLEVGGKNYQGVNGGDNSSGSFAISVG